MGDESTSNEKEARFWDLYRTYYAFARTFGRLGRLGLRVESLLRLGMNNLPVGLLSLTRAILALLANGSEVPQG